MKKTSISMLLAAVLATALVASGCHKKAGEAANASAASTLPAECENYIGKLETCVNKASASSPAEASSARQLLESTRQKWSTVTDKAALAQACKQANDKFRQLMAAQGCH